MIEAELAVVALVNDPAMIGWGQLGDIAFIIVNPPEQCIERRAEIETASATVADFVDPQRFLVQLSGINRVDEAEALHRRGAHRRSATGTERLRPAG